MKYSMSDLIFLSIKASVYTKKKKILNSLTSVSVLVCICSVALVLFTKLLLTAR